jgi:hypothetical protein
MDWKRPLDTLATGGLAGFHCADLGHPIGEIFYERQLKIVDAQETHLGSSPKQTQCVAQQTAELKPAMWKQSLADTFVFDLSWHQHLPTLNDPTVLQFQ